MAASPNIANYFEGKGTTSFTPEGGTLRDLGNCLKFSLSPEFETKEHKNFRGGSTVIDVTTITSKKLSGVLHLDEVTPENLAMLLFGEVDTNSATKKEFALLSLSAVKGELVLVGTNDTGSKYTVTLPSISITPTGEFDFIGEDYGVIELGFTVNQVAGVFGTIEETTAAA